MAAAADGSSRFTHLLQPIRDLSQNWNIDLAQELEEYLDELEHLSIAFDPADGGADGDGDVGVATRAQQQRQALASQDARVMNFAEAALLIQGTSVIYSRKVEYLYALVFQTLAHLTRPHEARAGAGESAGDDAAAGDPHVLSGDDALDVFTNPLPVVDGLDEARNITLKPVGAESQRQRSGGAAKSNTNIQASISLMGSLIPDERDHGETFKLLSCNLHASGVLLLDEASKKYLGVTSAADDYSDGQRGFGAARSDPVAALNFDSVADDFFMDGGGGDGDANQSEGDADAGDYGDVDFDYNDDDAGGDDDAAAAAAADERLDRQVVFAAPVTRSRHQERDPWAPLDPYDASSATSRPFRKGRSYPRRKKDTRKKASKSDEDGGGDGALDGLDDPLFKERFLFGAARPQWASWVWSETSETALERRFKSKFCKAPVLAKSCEELWKLETKWRGLLRRREAKEEQSAQAMLLQEQAEEEEEQQTHALNVNMANGVSALDLELNVGGDFDDDDDDDNGDDGAAFDGSGDWDDADHALPLSSQFVERFKDADDEFASDPSRQLSYDDICRQHIKSFMHGADQYVRETNLSKQVNDWQAKLSPILKEQDQHPPFDIHTYGRDILGQLAQDVTEKQATPKRKAAAIADDDDGGDGDDAVVPFGAIVGGMSQYQVCRMFLASLQLANNGNVQLVHGRSAAEQSRVPFQMKLLSTSNVYESLQEAA